MATLKIQPKPVQAVAVEFSLKEGKNGEVALLMKAANGKTYRIAQVNTDGTLHIRPANNESGLKVDFAGHVTVLFD